MSRPRGACGKRRYGRYSWAAALAASALAHGTPVDAQTGPCRFRGTEAALSERPSPLDSLSIPLGDADGMLCYSRPSARGRTVVGGQDPFGAPWRLGANEPTILHLPFAARVGNVDVAPGSYSLYAIPEAQSWMIVVNGNTNRWGIPIDADVRAADIGSFTVPVSRLGEHVETLAFTFERKGADVGVLVYRWELTTFNIPISRR